jgi:hypothetical protein
MMMGLSLRKSASKCGISNATAFYWRHKILGALQNITEIKQKLSGIVEADETFFPLSYKGNHSRDGFVMPRRAKKRGSENRRGLSHNQVCVPCAVDRNNGIVAMVSGTGKTSTDKVKAVLNNRITEASVLVTDKESSYRRFAIENNISLIQIKAEQRTFKGSLPHPAYQRISQPFEIVYASVSRGKYQALEQLPCLVCLDANE